MIEKFKMIFEKNKLEKDAVRLFETIEEILITTIKHSDISVWAMQPIYMIEDRSIIIAPFKDHLNIVSNPHRNEKSKQYKNAIITNISEVNKYYKTTPKGMLQIFLDDEINVDLLKRIFIDTFYAI